MVERWSLKTVQGPGVKIKLTCNIESLDYSLMLSSGFKSTIDNPNIKINKNIWTCKSVLGH